MNAMANQLHSTVALKFTVDNDIAWLYWTTSCMSNRTFPIAGKGSDIQDNDHQTAGQSRHLTLGNQEEIIFFQFHSQDPKQDGIMFNQAYKRKVCISGRHGGTPPRAH